MCGITGFIGLRPRTDAGPILERMLERIIHRGPDEAGRLVDQELAMGMRRLSIIDLADGSQPIADEAGRFHVIFNGEIYNYRELREELLERGHQLRTHSDTEVIVHLYEELGAGCLAKLRGMFGLAIWDQQERELFIARDRLGIKPLYYAEVAGEFVFASEIKSLLAHPQVSAEVNLHGVGQYLSLKYVPAPETMFAGIYSLPPGHYLRYRRGSLESVRYWDIPFTETSEAKLEQAHNEAEASDKLLDLLRESVRLRLRSDVPFGAFLSGGVDSSLIVALMAEELSSPVKTFSVGFDGEGLADELPYAAMVARRFGCEHHTLRIGAADFLEHAEDVLWHLDQPIADQATVATHMVAKLARQHVKMVLTGEGGDELFAGYARYQGERYAKYFSIFPERMGKAMRAIVARLPGLRRPKIAFAALTRRSESARFANWFPMFADDAKAQLLLATHKDMHDSAAGTFAQHLSQCAAPNSLQRMLYVDSKLWLPDYLLLRGDKLTMANSLEARVPLLDHHLVEFAAQLPAAYKLHGNERKYLLKKVARKLLPSEVIDRKKQGFPIPIEQWLRREAKHLVDDCLSRESLQRREFFAIEYVQRLVSEHTQGYADHATELWGMISLEMWMRKFID